MRTTRLVICLLCMSAVAYGQNFKGVSPQDAKSLQDVISRYHTGFTKNNPEMVLSSLGTEFIMFNGNYSDDPKQWQAHMFLTGDNLQRWPSNFLREAGPYKNSYEFLHMYVRRDAAVVVTRETGSNRFRSWKDESVTWLLGKRDGEWKIVGFFIKDIKNPE